MQQHPYDLTWWKDITSVIQSVVTTFAVVIAGIWFLRKRAGVPRASASCNITHKRLNDETFLLHIAIKIDNIGSVLLNPRNAKLSILKILPSTPGVLNRINNDEGFQKENDSLEIDFSCIHEKILSLESVVLEPGESHEIYYDCPLSSFTKVVKIHFSFENKRGLRIKKDSKIPLVWRLSSLYDL